MVPTVLCISDSQTVVALIEHLRGKGDRILRATSHPQAIAMASIEHIDVMVLFLQSLKAVCSTPATLKFVQPRAKLLVVTEDPPDKHSLPAGIDSVAQLQCPELPQLIRELCIEARTLDNSRGKSWR